MARRVSAARQLSERLSNVPGLTLPAAEAADVHSYWRYPIMVDPAVIPGGPVALGRLLRSDRIASAPRYIQKPAFECQVLSDQRTFGRSRFPFSHARSEACDYNPTKFVGTYRALERILVLPWNERLEPTHIDQIAVSILRAVDRLHGES